jgi:uncharacterized protein YydD (DUF2326 family)
MKDYRTIVEVIRSLVGSIDPVADASVDRERMENLEKMFNILSELLYDVNYIAQTHSNSQYGSARKIGQYAKKQLKLIFEDLKEDGYGTEN